MIYVFAHLTWVVPRYSPGSSRVASQIIRTLVYFLSFLHKKLNNSLYFLSNVLSKLKKHGIDPINSHAAVFPALLVPIYSINFRGYILLEFQ